MQDWFISWVYMDNGEVDGRGWNIRRDHVGAEAADVANRYIDELSKKSGKSADGFILIAMSKV